MYISEDDSEMSCVYYTHIGLHTVLLSYCKVALSMPLI